MLDVRLMGRRLLLLLMSLFLALGVAEIATRAWMHASGRSVADYVPQSRLSGTHRENRYTSHPFLPYVPRPGYHVPRHDAAFLRATVVQEVTYDTFGIRGGSLVRLEKPAHEYRIVCIGGSTTHGEGVDSNTWPALLEARLRRTRPGLALRVLNLGVENYTSHMDLVRFATLGTALQPDLVVVYSGINDAWILGARDPRPDGIHAIADLALDPVGLQRLVPSWVLERFHLLALATRSVDRGLLGVEYDLFKATVRGFERDPARPEAGVEYYRANLRSIAALSRSIGADVVFSTLHVLRDEETAGFARVVDEILNPAIRQAGAEAGVVVLEPAGSIPADDPSLHADVAHFTDEGRERLAAFFAAMLEERLPKLR